MSKRPYRLRTGHSKRTRNLPQVAGKLCRFPPFSATTSGTSIEVTREGDEIQRESNWSSDPDISGSTKVETGELCLFECERSSFYI